MIPVLGPAHSLSASIISTIELIVRLIQCVDYLDQLLLPRPVTQLLIQFTSRLNPDVHTVKPNHLLRQTGVHALHVRALFGRVAGTFDPATEVLVIAGVDVPDLLCTLDAELDFQDTLADFVRFLVLRGSQGEQGFVFPFRQAVEESDDVPEVEVLDFCYQMAGFEVEDCFEFGADLFAGVAEWVGAEDFAWGLADDCAGCVAGDEGVDVVADFLWKVHEFAIRLRCGGELGRFVSRFSSAVCIGDSGFAGCPPAFGRDVGFV
jgi:hypothetical protein